MWIEVGRAGGGGGPRKLTLVCACPPPPFLAPSLPAGQANNLPPFLNFPLQRCRVSSQQRNHQYPIPLFPPGGTPAPVACGTPGPTLGACRT